MERNNDDIRNKTLHDSEAKRSITKGILQPPKPKPYEDPGMSVRSTIGYTMDYFTRFVNENLVAARAGAFAGIFLLTVYGVSQTPLFFRYRTVSEVPASYFTGRRRLYGRVIGVEKNQTNGNVGDEIPVLKVRHLSLIGQLLPKPWFDVVMEYSPRQQAILRWNDEQEESSTSKADQISRDVLRIRMAGIEPPPLSRLTPQTEEFLERIAKERTWVSMQLLARQIEVEVDAETGEVQENPKRTKKRDMSNVLPDLKEDHYHDPLLDRVAVRASEEDGTYEHERQIAICKITHRPTMWQLFSTDLGEAMVLAGKANVSSTMLTTTENVGDMGTILTSTNTSFATKKPNSANRRRVRRFVDASEKLRDARSDVTYLERLTNAEFLAAQNSKGMWSEQEVRFHKREVVNEVEFQAKANLLQKLWRWIRGG